MRSDFAFSRWINISISGFSLAVIYTGLGRKQEALDALEQAYQERYYRLLYLGVDPLFDPLRAEARFAGLLRRIGLTL